MLLIKAFTVIAVTTQHHFIPSALPDLFKPIGIRESLARKSNHIRLLLGQKSFRLLKTVNPASSNNWSRTACLSNRRSNRCHGLNISLPWSLRIGDIRWHTLVATASGIGVGRPADLGLLGIIKFPPPRETQKIHPRSGKFCREKTGIIQATAPLDNFIAKEPAAHGKTRTNAISDPRKHLKGKTKPFLCTTTVTISPGVRGR